MKKFFLAAAITLGAVASCSQSGPKKAVDMNDQPFAEIPEFTITAPPAELGLDPWYKKYVDVNGIGLASSWRCPDSALVAAYRTIYYMTNYLPKDVHDSLVRYKTRVTCMGRYEGTTDVPEHRFLVNDTTLNWDLRARGLGGTKYDPVTSCAEENVLGYQIDKYHAEDILIHEFSHSIHLVGLVTARPDINERLQKGLDQALAAGKYQNTYAATNIEEYWAEGVQNWFNVNAEVPEKNGNGKHNWINTREEMKRYDPYLYDIIAEFFPEPKDKISCHKYVNEYNWTE